MRLPYNRGGLRWYLMVLGLLAGRATIPSILCGVPLLLAGIAMHLWAKGCLHQDQEVTTCGPYRFVRHPFYAGNALIDSAIVIMSGWTLLMCVFPLWWIAVYLRAMRREEADMTRSFGEAYVAYARRIPLLLPVRRPLPAALGFSWRNPNILETEVPRACRFLSYPFLFVISHEVWMNWAFLVSFPSSTWKQDIQDMTPLAFYSLLFILLLNGLAWQVKRAATYSDILHSERFSKTYVRVGFLVVFALAGTLLTCFEFEVDRVVIPLGALLIALSLFVHFRKPHEAVFAGLLLLIGASLVWEIPWLSFVPIILCAGDLLVPRLSPMVSPGSNRRSALPLIPYGSTGFLVCLTLFIFAAVAKELISDSL